MTFRSHVLRYCCRVVEKTESGKLGAAGIPAAETGIKSVPLMQTTADSVEQQGCGAMRVQ